MPAEALEFNGSQEISSHFATTGSRMDAPLSTCALGKSGRSESCWARSSIVSVPWKGHGEAKIADVVMASTLVEDLQHSSLAAYLRVKKIFMKVTSRSLSRKVGGRSERQRPVAANLSTKLYLLPVSLALHIVHKIRAHWRLHRVYIVLCRVRCISSTLVFSGVAGDNSVALFANNMIPLKLIFIFVEATSLSFSIEFLSLGLWWFR